jgi:O-antigen ligase/polysaccharide polymerase Wzy-like membrane protein
LLGIALLTGLYGTAEAELGLAPYLIMHVLLAGLWLAAVHAFVARRGELRPRLWPGPMLVLFLAGVSLIWVVLDENPVSALGYWRAVYWAMLAALLVAYAPFEAASSYRLTRLLLLAGGVISGYAFLRWQIGASTKEAALATQAAGRFTYLAGELRPIGGVGDAHGLSSSLAPLVPFSFALLLTLRDRWRVLAGAVLAASGAVLVATGVRAGLVAALAGIVVVLLLTLAAGPLGGRRIAASYLGLILCVGVIGTVVASESGGLTEQSKRFEAILAPEQDHGYQARLVVWRNAIVDIDQHPFGRGLGTATVGINNRIKTTAGAFNGDVVNSYLRVALEQGTMIAAVLVLTLIVILLALVRGALAAAKAEESALAIAAAGTLAAFAIHLSFESIYIGLGTALLSWLIIGLGMRQLSWRGRQPGQPEESLVRPPAAPIPAALRRPADTLVKPAHDPAEPAIGLPRRDTVAAGPAIEAAPRSGSKGMLGLVGAAFTRSVARRLRGRR